MTGIDRIQPTLFTMQVALAATMKSYGVRPGAVIGHSLGEAAAAVVAGALSLRRRGARHLPPLAADVPHRRLPAPWHRWNCLPSRCFRS